MKLPNKVYDILKWIVILLLPASAILYRALANEWGFLYAEQIYNTVMYIQAFLGAILGISTINYNKDGDVE